MGFDPLRSAIAMPFSFRPLEEPLRKHALVRWSKKALSDRTRTTRDPMLCATCVVEVSEPLEQGERCYLR